MKFSGCFSGKYLNSDVSIAFNIENDGSDSYSNVAVTRYLLPEKLSLIKYIQFYNSKETSDFAGAYNPCIKLENYVLVTLAEEAGAFGKKVHVQPDVPQSIAAWLSRKGFSSQRTQTGNRIRGHTRGVSNTINVFTTFCSEITLMYTAYWHLLRKGGIWH